MSDKKRVSRAYRSIIDSELNEALATWAHELYNPAAAQRVEASPEPRAPMFLSATRQEAPVASAVAVPEKKRWRDHRGIRMATAIGIVAGAAIGMMLAHGDGAPVETKHLTVPTTPTRRSDPTQDLQIDAGINPSPIHKYERTFVNHRNLPAAPYRYNCLAGRAYDTTEGANIGYDVQFPDRLEIYPRAGGQVLRFSGVTNDGAYLQPADQATANTLWAWGCYLYSPAPPHVSSGK